MALAARLVYLANSRLPTEKAHGYQIAKMCEAFARHGADVVLIHPRRYQADARLRERSVFDYYGVAPQFEVRTIFNLDPVRLERVVPHRLFVGLTAAHALGWGLGAAVYARREQADLYYTRDLEPAFWLTELGLPVVLEMHEVPRQGRRALIGRIARGRSLRLVVAMTSFGRDQLVRLGVPRDRITVQPNGVDLTLFESLPSRAECRRRLGLPLDRAIVGYVGRFHTFGREKGIPQLIEAMGTLGAVDGREPLLLCVGGPMTAVPSYREVARRHGVALHRLQFVDHVPARDVPYWIKASDVASLPLPVAEHYTYFSSSLKVFEYMAAEVPILATRLPAIEEVLQHEQTAWLAPPGDAAALSAGIETLLQRPAEAQMMARRARKDVERYTWMRRAAAIMASSVPSPALGQAEIA
jgi:glycosyltransferase involved in cell wall biosynthesis